MNAESKTFGQYLRSLRKKKGLTLKELGGLVGFSYSYLSQLERGERGGAGGIPSPDILKLLYKPLDVDFFTLMEKAGYLPVGETELAMDSYNKTAEEYLNQLYIRAQENPDAGVYSKIVDVIKEYIDDVNYDDTIFTIVQKIQSLNDLRAKESLVSDLWNITYDVSRDELDYILNNEDLTFCGQSVTDLDRDLIRSYMKALFRDRLNTKSLL
ncbi:MAG: helix-turn-helix domain-containing protein [Gorillibacterium sp.]|nr:helix-turn-helix domain-containing protein [Gorillibacterium sp.]